MKKLWSAVDTAVSAGAAQLKSSVWKDPQGEHAHGQPVSRQSGNGTSSNAAGAANSHAAGEKQYLRLPYESARKLRWFDKADLSALVKTHLREKRELEDTVAALKRLLLRKGVTESDMDAEVKALLDNAADVKETDEGVASVLLTSCMAEVETLQEQNAELQEQLTKAQLRLQHGAGNGGMFTLGGDDTTTSFTTAAQHGQRVLPANLLQQMNSLIQQCEEAMSSAEATARKLRKAEHDLSNAEIEIAMAAQQPQHNMATWDTQGHTDVQAVETAGNGWDVEDDAWDTLSPAEQNQAPHEETATETAADASVVNLNPQSRNSSNENVGQVGQETSVNNPAHRSMSTSGTTQPSVAGLLAKLQRLERERRDAEEQITDLMEQLAVSRAAAEKAASLQEFASQASDRIKDLTAALEVAQSDLTAAKTTVKATEELAEKRAAEIRRLQHAHKGAEQLSRLQDLLAESQDKASDASRRLTVVEARCTKAEAALKEKSKELQQLQAEHAAALAAATAATASSSSEAISSSKNAGRSTSLGGTPPTDIQQLTEQLKSAEASVATSQKELAAARSTISALEVKLKAAESREARLMADIRDLEAVTAERDMLATQILGLKDKVAEVQGDCSQLKHYKQLASQLSQGRVQLEEELLVTGQLVTQLDIKLREALTRAESAERAVQAAEARAHAAVASVSKEVDARLAAAAANRASWPVAALEEIDRLDDQVSSLTGDLAAMHAQTQQAAAKTTVLQSQVDASKQRIKELEQQLFDLNSKTALQIEDLTAAIQDSQRELNTAHAALRKAERENNALKAMALAAQASAGTNRGAQDASGKWQVQNTVGGGSLYGVADKLQSHTSMGTGANGSNLLGLQSQSSLPGQTLGSNPSIGPFSAAYQEQQQQQLQQQQELRSEGSFSSQTSFANGSEAALGFPTTPSIRGNSVSSAGKLSSRQASGAGSKSGQKALESVDIVYLKNVVLKFLEAALAGRGPERDALLPAVATLLQASPAEYQVLKKVVHATAPPSTQVLSAFGIRIPGM